MVRIRTYTGDIIKRAALMCQLIVSWFSVRVSLKSRCSMPSGSKIPRDKAQERTGLQCVRGNMPLSSYPPISVSLYVSTTAYQTFLFVPDSIKLDSM